VTNSSPFHQALPGPRLNISSSSLPAPLRLAVDLSHLRPGGESGGVKPFVLEYLRELAALEGEKLTLILLTCSSSHGEIRAMARPQDELICVRDDGAGSLKPLGNWRGGELLVPIPPANLLLLLKVDLLYLPLISSEFACPGIPTVSTVVDVLHRDYPATLPRESNAHRETLFRELVRVSDRIQCISDYTAAQMRSHYGIPSNRTFRSHIVIHHRFKNFARQPKPDGYRPYFFYPANSWPHKNHETLLVAYRLYRHKHGAEAWPLFLTGYENERMQHIIATARHLGLEEHVSFHGHLPEAELAGLWQNAGALVFPSLHEGFGIPLIEAMHFGVPILSSRAGSLPEVAQEAAHYADALNPEAWASAMVAIATSPLLRSELIAKGNKRLDEFSLSNEIAEFRQAIHEVIQSPTRRWCRGVHIDGWMEGMALLGLPNVSGNMRIELRFAPIPVTRRVRLYLGLVPLGGFNVPEGKEFFYSVEVMASGDPLVLEVPDASNLNPNDFRHHGVILSAAFAIDQTGRSHDLLEELQ
jgi:glycosyltransferase involved in cell wall biosynthesis